MNSVIEALKRAGSRGLTTTDLRKVRGANAQLKKLGADGSIRGPLRIGRSRRYFLTEQAPTLEQIETRIEQRLQNAGLKLTSFSDLKALARIAPKAFFKDALSALKADGRIVELRGPMKSKLYLHREPLLEQLRAERVPPREKLAISLERIRPVYEALKAQQGGISAVTIFDVLNGVGGSKEELHQLLLDEAKRGRVTLHPAATVNFSREITEAGIKLEGQPYPFVTVVLKS